MSAAAPRRVPRRLLAVGVLVLLLGGGWWAFGSIDGATAQWETVRRGDLVLGVELTGVLEAVDSSQVGPAQLKDVWQFKISHLAPEGEEVVAGTPVLGFDTSELQQRLQQQLPEADSARKEVEKFEDELVLQRKQAELQLAEAAARHRKASLKVDRPGELASAGELAQARLDLELATKELAYLDSKGQSQRRSAEATLAALRTQQQRAEQRVAEIQRSIAEMMRKAPRSGTVIYVTDPWQGQKKKVGDSCWRGEYILELADLAKMKGLATVHEADAGKVAEGQSVQLRLDAHPDVEFEGKVRSIWRTVEQESWNSPLKVVRLDVELASTDPKRMRPGMRFRGTVETERVPGVVLIPAEAVELTTAGPIVRRRTWRGTEDVAVRLGRRNASQVEVLDGLSEGEAISMTRRAEPESKT